MIRSMTNINIRIKTPLANPSPSARYEIVQNAVIENNERKRSGRKKMVKIDNDKRK